MSKSTYLFKALSSQTRLRILKMLQIKPLCVSEITDVLLLAISTVSQHLSVLKKAGFIIEDRDGKWINYHIDVRPLDPRLSAILGALDFWVGDNKLVEADKEKVKKVNRLKICKT